MQQSLRRPSVWPLPRVAAASLLAAGAAAVISGCSAGDEVMPAVAVPAEQSSQGVPGDSGPTLDAPGHGMTDHLRVSEHQRAYLDALAAAGVRPSSELMALSVGTYVCQARAAGQSDQAVWDFVLPMVRGDVHDTHPESRMSTLTVQVNDITGDYIRIATERLC